MLWSNNGTMYAIKKTYANGEMKRQKRSVMYTIEIENDRKKQK